MKTLEEFSVLADYRAFTRARFKQTVQDGDPVYISVAPFDFDCWSGNAVLVGPKGARLHKILKKENVKFREGRCVVQDKTVYVGELSGGLLKGANKTLEKLSIGFTLKSGAPPSDGAETGAALTNWADYKVHVRDQFKKIAAQPVPFFLSKKRATFDHDGASWQGFCVLAGPKARTSMLEWKKQGLAFLEGTCTADGKRLLVKGIPTAALKFANKTLVRLKMGYIAVPPIVAASISSSEVTFQTLLKAIYPAIQKAVQSRSANRSELLEHAGMASKLHKAKDFDGATKALLKTKTFLNSAVMQTPLAAVGAKGPSANATKPSRAAQLDNLVDSIVGSAQQRTKALLKWDVQQPELFERPTELETFFADLNSGISKVDDYVAYVRGAVDYFSKTNDSSVLQGIAGALNGVEKVSKRLQFGITKLVDAIDAIKQVKTFIDTANRFVAVTRKMDPRDIDSVKTWVQSVQGLWAAADPFLQWIKKEKLLVAAMRGSKLAGVIGATLPIVAAQFQVGLKALEAGLKNVNAYLQRLEKITDEIEGVPRPSKPQPPGEWQTMEEIGRGAEAWRDMVLRSNIDSAHFEKMQEGTQVFDSRVFPRLYRRVKKQVRAALVKKTKQARAAARSLEKKLELVTSRQEKIGTRLGNLRLDQTDFYKKYGRINPALKARISKLHSRLEEVERRISPLMAAISNAEMAPALRRWRECIIQLDGTPMPTEDQIKGFRELRRRGQGFPLYNKIYDAGLKGHLDALSKEFRSELV